MIATVKTCHYDQILSKAIIVSVVVTSSSDSKLATKIFENIALSFRSKYRLSPLLAGCREKANKKRKKQKDVIKMSKR